MFHPRDRKGACQMKKHVRSPMRGLEREGRSFDIEVPIFARKCQSLVTSAATRIETIAPLDNVDSCAIIVTLRRNGGAVGRVQAQTDATTTCPGESHYEDRETGVLCHQVLQSGRGLSARPSASGCGQAAECAPKCGYVRVLQKRGRASIHGGGIIFTIGPSEGLPAFALREPTRTGGHAYARIAKLMPAYLWGGC